MAFRMSAETGAPVFSDRAFNPFRCLSPSQMFVRFMFPLVRLQAHTVNLYRNCTRLGRQERLQRQERHVKSATYVFSIRGKGSNPPLSAIPSNRTPNKHLYLMLPFRRHLIRGEHGQCLRKIQEFARVGIPEGWPWQTPKRREIPYPLYGRTRKASLESTIQYAPGGA